MGYDYDDENKDTFNKKKQEDDDHDKECHKYKKYEKVASKESFAHLQERYTVSF